MDIQSLSLRQKANFTFTPEQWSSLTKEQKSMIFNARKTVKKGGRACK